MKKIFNTILLLVIGLMLVFPAGDVKAEYKTRLGTAYRRKCLIIFTIIAHLLEAVTASLQEIRKLFLTERRIV